MPNVANIASGDKRRREEVDDKSKDDIEEELNMTRIELTMLTHECVMPRTFSVSKLKRRVVG